MNDVVDADISGLCGFGRCRAPLPGPGPKGGRPYAYCPDRSWPGGKTCKQLAAAQEALAEALEERGSAELVSATTAFAAAADRVAGPLAEALAVAEALRGALAEELGAATARAERAETTAATERGLRVSAESAATETRAAAETAVHEARSAAEATVREAQANAEAEIHLVRATAEADVQLARTEAETLVEQTRQSSAAEVDRKSVV